MRRPIRRQESKDKSNQAGHPERHHDRGRTPARRGEPAVGEDQQREPEQRGLGLAERVPQPRGELGARPAAPGAAFATAPDGPVQALRISLGGSAPRVRIVQEIRRLDAMLAQAGGGLV